MLEHFVSQDGEHLIYTFGSRGRQGQVPPPPEHGPKFHVVFEKNWLNSRLTSHLVVGTPEKS